MKDKPIAVIHWIRDGTEHQFKVYTQYDLAVKTQWVREQRYVSWTCMVDMDAYAPRTSA